jgi:hypothetical protein
MNRNQIAWWLWAVGTVLIVLCWTNAVNLTIGWFGFGMGLVGSIMSWGLRPPRGGPPPESPQAEKKD